MTFNIVVSVHAREWVFVDQWQGVYNSWRSPEIEIATGNAGNLEFEIVPRNTGNLQAFSWCS